MTQSPQKTPQHDRAAPSNWGAADVIPDYSDEELTAIFEAWCRDGIYHAAKKP
jgi:hypothetical protein